MKRFEVWLLLVVVIGGVTWALMSSSNDTFEESSQNAAITTGNGIAVEKRLTLRRLVAKRDYSNVRLDIDLKYHNATAEKLIMTAPKVRLLAGEGREVPSFFLPFAPLPEVAAHHTQEVQLRYWLEKQDLDGPLELEIDGQKLLLKDGTPFAIDLLKNGEETIIKKVEWSEGMK